jgi:hypothetical protein
MRLAQESAGVLLEPSEQEAIGTELTRVSLGLLTDPDAM